ncbi:MAG TPA: phosphohydrolase [Clostridiales bacterium]|nr:phosphohydrolase [Clostridiales bacterium]
MDLMKIFDDINTHLLNDEKPSDFLNEISDNPLFLQSPFSMLAKLTKTEQSSVHHPEGNVWNHTMLVIDEAAKQKTKSKNAAVFMWAALLHDIGKPLTTRVRKGKIISYDHDKIGARLSKDFLLSFIDHTAVNDTLIDEVSNLTRYHMQFLFVINDLPFADILGMKRNTDIEEVALLGLCDRLGRTNVDRIKEEVNIGLFLKKCREK